MKDMIQKLGKTSLIYGLGSMSNKILAFLLLPIYTRFLTPEDYGILALLTTTATIVGVVAQMGIGSALFWAILREKMDESESISTALFFVLIEGAFIFGILGLFAPQLSNVIFKDHQYSYLLQLALTSTFLSAISLIFMTTLRIKEHAKLYAIFSVANFLLSTFFKIGFVVFLDLGLDGIIYSNVIVALFFTVLYLLFMKPNIRPVFSYSIMVKMLGFGAPMIMVGLSNLIMTSSDRYFLQAYVNEAEVGLYSLGYNLGLAIMLVAQAIQLAWPAQFLKITHDDNSNAPVEISHITTYYFAFLALLALGISIFAREAVIIITTESFYAAYTVVPLIVFTYLLHGLRNMTNIGIWVKNKTQYLIPITIIAAILNILLNFLLIPPFGMMGAAWATLFSYGISLVLSLIVNLRLYYIPYEYNRIIKVTIVCIIIFIMSSVIPTNNIFLTIGIKALIIATYPVILFLLNFYNSNEVAFLKRLFSRIITQ